MKVKVNKEQPVEDIENELLWLGFTFNCGCDDSKVKMIIVRGNHMHYEMYDYWDGSHKGVTTLEDLKGM